MDAAVQLAEVDARRSCLCHRSIYEDRHGCRDMADADSSTEVYRLVRRLPSGNDGGAQA